MEASVATDEPATLITHGPGRGRRRTYETRRLRPPPPLAAPYIPSTQPVWRNRSKCVHDPRQDLQVARKGFSTLLARYNLTGARHIAIREIFAAGTST